MSEDTRTVVRISMSAVVAVYAALAVAVVVVGLDLAQDERAQLIAMATPPRLALAALSLLLLGALLVVLVQRLVQGAIVPARRMARAIDVMLEANAGHRVVPAGAPSLVTLAERVNALADAHDQVRRDVQAEIDAARAAVEAERNRLAALMAELASSVVVCNSEGTILLYNAAARQLFEREAGEVLIGLGRSVFAVMDRHVVAHAIERIERAMAKGEAAPTAHFIAAGPRNQMLRVQVAPVAGQRAAASGPAEPIPLAGYVLLLADVTDAIASGTRRDGILQTVLQDGRSALANIRAAIESLIDFPDLQPARRERFTRIIQEESVKLSEHLEAATRAFSDQLQTQWPLEEMRGEDLIAVARARIQQRVGIGTGVDRVDPESWLRVDSFSLAQGLSYVAARLSEEFKVRAIEFRLRPAGRFAHLDLVWRGAPLSPETAFAWENDAFQLGAEASPLTLKAVMARHGGELWYQRDLPAQRAYFRFVLPLAAAPARVLPSVAADSRPEYFDFDLFRARSGASTLDDRRLVDLNYTVFDAEMTGLDPATDEIISIGAVRIVNSRLLHGETFEALVDPGRSLTPESIAIHGITPELLLGQPRIDEVLPRFHRFAADTVLLAHNAAFDLRFLSLKEARTGVRLDQPVLDTLLLSAVAYPDQEGHSLEAIAARLGISIVGRHTALGDALVTGEIFLRLLAPLAARGVETLGQARAASEKTYYARIRY